MEYHVGIRSSAKSERTRTGSHLNLAPYLQFFSFTSTVQDFCTSLEDSSSMRFTLLSLLPLISALQLPHIPTPQSVLQAADSILHGSSALSPANDMTLASIPADEHVLITNAHHPVRHRPLVRDGSS